MYDLICHVYPLEEQSLEALQSVLRKASRRYSKDKYQRYLNLWMLRLAVESITKKHKRFQSERDGTPSKDIMDILSLEERLVVLLRDRRKLNMQEIASVMRIPVGRAGRSLTYAREKIARQLLNIDWYRGATTGQGEELGLSSLISRVEMNLLIGEEKSKRSFTPYQQEYIQSISHSSQFVENLKGKKFGEIENAIRLTKIMPIFSRPASYKWQDLSWQYKLAVEAAGLGLVGLLAVVALPWAFSHVNKSAFYDGRFGDLFTNQALEMKEAAQTEISTDRLLASSDSSKDVEANAKENIQDEFADVDFPSGDAETGAAPIAPSRQNAAVYRLIVQSTSPADLMTPVKNLFSGSNVKEREMSGRVMPGGVYFDGITSEASYEKIREEIKKLGTTKVYSTATAHRAPEEKARLIVWIQQI